MNTDKSYCNCEFICIPVSCHCASASLLWFWTSSYHILYIRMTKLLFSVWDFIFIFGWKNSISETGERKLYWKINRKKKEIFFVIVTSTWEFINVSLNVHTFGLKALMELICDHILYKRKQTRLNRYVCSVVCNNDKLSLHCVYLSFSGNTVIIARFSSRSASIDPFTALCCSGLTENNPSDTWGYIPSHAYRPTCMSAVCLLLH